MHPQPGYSGITSVASHGEPKQSWDVGIPFPVPWDTPGADAGGPPDPQNPFSCQ